MKNINEMMKTLEARTAQALEKIAREQEEGKKSGEVVRLPVWPNNQRAMPNEAARSSLFTCRRGPRRLFKEEQIFCLGDTKMTYTGGELRAHDDELVWLQMLQYAREQNLGEWIEFTAYQLCKDIGWEPDGAHYKKIRGCLAMLSATCLVISNKRLGMGFSVRLVEDFEWKEEGKDGKPLKKYRVKINLKMKQWFGENQFTQVEWDSYKNLSGTARRLWDYIKSHREPFPISIEKVKEMCDLTVELTYNLRKTIKEAISELKEAGLIEDGGINEHDNVWFKRKNQ